jgi:putative holliday junction resolvase
MGKLMGVDYGERRIGIAISDEEQNFAFERGIWDAKEFFDKITDFIKSEDIEKIVLGYPLSLKGNQTVKTEEVLDFKNKLESVAKVPVELVDERLSSRMAAKAAGTSKNIDSLAAQIFLQNYIELNKH